MPYPLNNVATSDGYTEAATAVLPRPGMAMSVQVYNAAIYYRLLLIPIAGMTVGGYQADAVEKFLAPAFAQFDADDLAPGMLFAGIQVRSAAAGVPANVSVS